MTSEKTYQMDIRGRPDGPDVAVVCASPLDLIESMIIYLRLLERRGDIPMGILPLKLDTVEGMAPAACELARAGYTMIEIYRLLENATSRAKDRAIIISKLREICEVVGDNDWPDNLHIADILEKHIMKHLEL